MRSSVVGRDCHEPLVGRGGRATSGLVARGSGFKSSILILRKMCRLRSKAELGREPTMRPGRRNRRFLGSKSGSGSISMGRTDGGRGPAMMSEQGEVTWLQSPARAFSILLY